MQHHSIIAYSPSRPTLYLLSNKTILDYQQVSRELLFVKYMAILFFEFIILIITYFHYAILDTKRIAIIFIYGMIFNLYCPIFQIIAIKTISAFFIFSFKES